jgi:hypothetical protein
MAKDSRSSQDFNKKKVEKSYNNNNYRQAPKDYDNVSKQVLDLRNPNIEKTLVENFVALQKVMTNLALSFDNLSGKITKLLDLFEASAKTLSEKDSETPKTDKEISEKIDRLLEHNKVFAKGLSLLHEKEEELRSFPGKTSEEGNKNYSEEELRSFPRKTSEEPQVTSEPKPLQVPRTFPQPPQQIQRRTDADGYQKSMSQNS